MTARRGCLIGVVGVLAVCVLGCGIGWFVVLPRVQDAVADPIGERIGTTVAEELAAAPGAAPRPGTSVITAEDLTDQLADEIAGSSGIQVDDATVRIDPTGVELALAYDQGEIVYTAQLAAEAGRLVVRDVDASQDFMRFLLPADKLAGAIEAGVNGYLAANGLRLVDLELTDGAMTLTTEVAR